MGASDNSTVLSHAAVWSKSRTKHADCKCARVNICRALSSLNTTKHEPIQTSQPPWNQTWSRCMTCPSVPLQSWTTCTSPFLLQSNPRAFTDLYRDRNTDRLHGSRQDFWIGGIAPVILLSHDLASIVACMNTPTEALQCTGLLTRLSLGVFSGSRRRHGLSSYKNHWVVCCWYCFPAIVAAVRASFGF